MVSHNSLDLTLNTSLIYAPCSISAKNVDLPKVSFIDNEPEFRWELLKEQMAFEKLHEGIRKFAEDGETLKSTLRKKLQA